jgi:DNA-binding NtrC family response regulator
MKRKKLDELIEYFRDLTIKKQMRILAHKASRSKLFYQEIMSEFERTLLQEMLEKHNYNKLKLALEIKLHRNTILQKMKKLNIKDKVRKKK